MNSSRLVRLLADRVDRADADHLSVAASKQSFAEKLGLWLDWPDAIALAAALTRDSASGLPMQRLPGAGAAAGMVEEVVRVRAELATAIADDGVFNPGRPPAKRPPAAAGAVRRRVPEPVLSPAPVPAPILSTDPVPDLDFSPYRRAYVNHQRAMAAAIGPLRAQVRAGLAGLHPALGQLAALDAVLDDALAARERHLLAKVPGLLEQHVARGRRLQPAPTAGWMAGVCQDLQGVLLAELDIRLQPILGMLEAMGYEVTGQS